jgi:hypothetical protein
VSVYRDARDGAGPVIVDGAFTRLYRQWQEAGAARYVVNAACYLAVTSRTEKAFCDKIFCPFVLMDDLVPSDSKPFRHTYVGISDEPSP